MDQKRRRELLWEYRNRKPEMGILSYLCVATGESFLGISRETRADINSNRMKLTTNWHPNKALQALWNRYGEEGFQVTVEVLPYDEKEDKQDYTKELEELLAKCLDRDEKSHRLYLR